MLIEIALARFHDSFVRGVHVAPALQLDVFAFQLLIDLEEVLNFP